MKASSPALNTFHMVVLVLILSVVHLLVSSAPLAAQVETPLSSESVVAPVVTPTGEPICGSTVFHSGAITKDTWWNAGYVHVLDSDVTVNAGVTLRIDSGAVVKAKANATLYVKGRILAVGTESFPVYFTSWKDDSLCGDSNGDGTASEAAADDWGWIEFSSSSDASSIVRRTSIRFSGYDSSVYSSGAAIRLNNVSPTLANITFADNWVNAVEVVSGDWTSKTWGNTSVVYWLRGDVTVLAANTLTIAPDMKIKASGSASLHVKGKLISDGTQTAPITFTSIRDDDICGIGATDERICDSNNDGTGSGAAANDWGWIEFSSSSDASSLIRRTSIRFSGYDSSVYSSGAAIRLNNVSPTLANITFADNWVNAVEVVSGDWTSKTWGNTSVVYWLRGDVTVLAANTLTIAPDMKIKASGSASLHVKGKLISDGTQTAPITFTSIRDDDICGIGATDERICDSNNDGTGSGAAANDWGWIEFSSSSDANSLIRRTSIRFSGYDSSVYSSGAAIRLNNVSPTLANITFADNWVNAVEVVSGDWTSKTWGNTSVVYWLRGDVTVLAANTLTIAPDMKIKASGSASLHVKGKLISDGTQTAPITFTSIRDDDICGIGATDERICDSNNDGTGSGAAANDWGWIEFSSSSDANSIVRRTSIRFSGYDSSVYSSGAAIRLNNVSPTLANITFADNWVNAVEVVSGDWTSKTWGNTSVVYWLRGDVTVLAANTLTIAPDMKIKASGSASLHVKGKLISDGTQTAPITFTSIRDDDICGIGATDERICDSNNDGTGSGAAANDWGWIEFSSSSDANSIVRRTTIRFSGYDSSVYSSGAAIRLNNVSPTIAYTLFRSNYRGVELLSGARPTLTCNDFADNQDYGMYNGQPTTIVTAEGQWWNSSSGPSHATNPGGAGDRVSNGIDFTPWATSPCTIPTYAISGRAKDASNNGIPGVTISDGAGHTATTDSSGSYTLGGLTPGMHTLTPHKSGYLFYPFSAQTDVPPSKTGLDFTGTALTYSVAGRVTTSNGNPISGVTISDDRGHSATSDAYGNYSLTGLAAGTYTLTPQKNSYTFSQAYRSVTVPPDVTGQNFVVATAPTPTPTPSPTPAPKQWTLMYFIAADNDLEPRLPYIYRSLLEASRNPSVNIVAFVDGKSAPAKYQVYAPTGATIFVKPELNTGNPSTLADFVRWAKGTYPAAHYALTIYDHGQGVTGAAFDDHAPGDLIPECNFSECLSPRELRAATTQAGHLDVIEMWACLMGTIEVGYELRGQADYYVASENLEWGYMLPDWYVLGNREVAGSREVVIPPMTQTTTPRQLSEAMAMSRMAQTELMFGRPGTVSVSKLSEVEAVVAKVNKLATLLLTRMSTAKSLVGEIRSASVLQHFDSNGDQDLTDADEMVDLYHFAELTEGHTDDVEIADAAQQLQLAIKAYVLPNSNYRVEWCQQKRHANQAEQQPRCIYLLPFRLEKLL